MKPLSLLRRPGLMVPRHLAILTALSIALGTATPARAQQHDHPQRPDTTAGAMPGMDMHHDGMHPGKQHEMRHRMPHDTLTTHQLMTHHMMHQMMAAGPLGISMERGGSGTSWLPDISPMYAVHRMLGPWTMMLHGEAFLQYDDQGGDRGGRQLGSINWGMAMASRDFGTPATDGHATSRLTLRTMLSAESFTVTPRGYPLLLQTGESYNGVPLHDRQHPHDLFMELAALYDRELTPNLGLELYAAPAGEPASGPVAFMHRPSAANDLFAPLSHHWQDATHISFGVLTAGLFTKMVKVEGSVFNGREPDQYRYNIDLRRLDSYSGRMTVNPAPQWSVEGSYAFLNHPEALAPNVSQHRVTATAMYGRHVGTHGDWSTSVVYGASKYSDRDALSNSGLIETNVTLDEHNTVFGRAEIVQKSAEDLALSAPPLLGRQFDVGTIALGYVRELVTGYAGSLGLGARGTVNMVPDALRSYYGTQMPLGLGVFLRVRPGKMHEMHGGTDMRHMHHMDHMDHMGDMNHGDRMNMPMPKDTSITP